MNIFDAISAVTSHMAPANVSLDQWQHVGVNPDIMGLTSRPPVPNSEDLERIVALPRRPQVDLGLTSPTAHALVEIMNDRLRRPDWMRTDCKCAQIAPERTRDGRKACITSLHAAQAWALYEAPLANGLVGLLATGSGKTSVGFFMPVVMMGCKLAVGLVPSKLVKQLEREYKLWREHWRVPILVLGQHDGHFQGGEFFAEGTRPTLHVVPYSRLQMPSSTDLFKSLVPDLVYADEFDLLANLNSARTARVIRLFADNPTTRFCGWTGTPWSLGKIARRARWRASTPRNASCRAPWLGAGCMRTQ